MYTFRLYAKLLVRKNYSCLQTEQEAALYMYVICCILVSFAVFAVSFSLRIPLMLMYTCIVMVNSENEKNPNGVCFNTEFYEF